jgi:hypothetical protein
MATQTKQIITCSVECSFMACPKLISNIQRISEDVPANIESLRRCA